MKAEWAAVVIAGISIVISIGHAVVATVHGRHVRRVGNDRKSIEKLRVLFVAVYTGSMALHRQAVMGAGIHTDDPADAARLDELRLIGADRRREQIKFDELEDTVRHLGSRKIRDGVLGLSRDLRRVTTWHTMRIDAVNVVQAAPSVDGFDARYRELLGEIDNWLLKNH